MKEYSLSVAVVAGPEPRGASCVVIIKKEEKGREERRGDMCSLSTRGGAERRESGSNRLYGALIENKLSFVRVVESRPQAKHI
jgi:hypothetical protein